MKRSGVLLRLTPLVRRRPIRPVSERRENQADEYLQARMIVFARDGWCQGTSRGLTGLCWGGLVIHHIKPVGRFPELRCDPDNCVLLCTGHHAHLHDHPLFSRAMGLLE